MAQVLENTLLREYVYVYIYIYVHMHRNSKALGGILNDLLSVQTRYCLDRFRKVASKSADR